MDNRSMFYGATPQIFEKAKMLRKNMTRHEILLWNKLKANQVLGLRFKAQHPIDQYIVDFYCHPIKLVIEIDGVSHNTGDQIQYDKERTQVMNDLGIITIRFQNEELESGLLRIVRIIEDKCKTILLRDDNSLSKQESHE